MNLRKENHCFCGTPHHNKSKLLHFFFQNDVGPTPFQRHFDKVIHNAVLDQNGEPNVYFCPTFVPSIERYFLPHAALWSSLMLGEFIVFIFSPIFF